MSTHQTNEPILIQKEEVEQLHFPAETVERSISEKEIITKLHDAMSLGNLHHSKIKITFADAEGIKQVETTVWTADETFVTLKKGVAIPIRRIISVNL
jgi:hypothetical protein